MAYLTVVYDDEEMPDFEKVQCNVIEHLTKGVVAIAKYNALLSCQWKLYDENVYDTECNNMHTFFDGDIGDFKFCPYCGGDITHG